MIALVIIEAVVIALLLMAIAGTDHKANGDPRYWAYRFTYPTTEVEWEAANTIAVALNKGQLERFRQQAHAEADDARREFEHALRAGFRAEMDALTAEHAAVCEDYDRIIDDRDREITNLTRIIDELSAPAGGPSAGPEMVPEPTISSFAPVVSVPVETASRVADDLAGGFVDDGLPWLPRPASELGVIGDHLQDRPTRFGVGDGVVLDLDAAPHWLVAGATGMGKSNALNLILLQAVNHDPRELNLMLIDPKRVELSPYRDAEQTVAYASDTADAVDVLRSAVDEMERRYRLLEAARVRNIDAYRKLSGERLPRVLVVVDELADLMLLARKQAEPLIQRLTQLGRAAGVHVIVATQRPSVDVVTGTIKANVTGRLAFGVATVIDSRVILDQPGAEKLGRPGEALLSTGGVKAPRRVMLPYVDDDCVLGVMEPDSGIAA